MTNQTPEDPENALDLIIETKERRLVDRPKKLDSLVDTQAMRFLEAMDFQSFNNLSSAFEKFMMDAPLFQGDVSFARAAMALDLTARLFSTIDTDKNNLLSREEFAYLLLKTTEANRQALSWLIENFHAFTQACFFKDQIAKDDVEAARNVFHGLKIAKEKLGFDKQPTLENLKTLDPKEIKNLLDNRRSELTPHEASGLQYLLDHIKKYVGQKPGEKGPGAKEQDEKSDAKEKSKEQELEKKRKDELEEERLKQLEGVLDPKSLRTLKSLKLNSFESLFLAFAEFIEDSLNFKHDKPFGKAANALDTTANQLSELEMNEDHFFTRDELLIVSKMSQKEDKDKKQMNWLVKHFDAFTKAFFFPGKAKKRDIKAASKVFQGLDFVQARFSDDPNVQKELDREIRNYLNQHRGMMQPKHREGLETLVDFMERHARD